MAEIYPEDTFSHCAAHMQTDLQIRLCEYIFKKILTILLFKTMNLITNLMSALLFPQIVSVLSSESVFFES